MPGSFKKRYLRVVNEFRTKKTSLPKLDDDSVHGRLEEYNFSHCASAAAVAVAETAAIRIIKVSFFPSTFSSILLTGPWKRGRPPLRRFRYL